MSMPNPDIKLIPPLAASIVTILAASGIAVAQPDESPRNQLVRVVTISQEGLPSDVWLTHPNGVITNRVHPGISWVR